MGITTLIFLRTLEKIFATRYFESVIEKNISVRQVPNRSWSSKKEVARDGEKQTNCSLKSKITTSWSTKQSVSLNEAILLVEILPNIATSLQLIQVCPANGAVVERGFALTNFVMNGLKSSMNISTLDATMWVTYVNEITDDVVDKITDIWKKRGNRQTEL